jgi:hypothetical protein
MAAVAARPAGVARQALTDGGDLAVEGAFTCDFTLPAGLAESSPEPIGGVLERDRMIMSREPGMLRKHVPLGIDFTTGNLFSGGRYLFDTEERAKDYKTFVSEEFAIEGVQFLDRPEFLETDCHSWSVVAARDFADIHTSQVVLRTERWSVPANNQRRLLKGRWPAIRAAAAARGLTSVWLLYNKQEQLVSLVYFANRVAPHDPSAPDFASLFTLQGSPALGDLLGDLGYTKHFDRTHWSWTIWFPFLRGDRGEPSLWPNSPPFPEPFVGDGVCEPSRGETSATAGADCGPMCGDGICQTGESVMACPSDCRQ